MYEIEFTVPLSTMIRGVLNHLYIPPNIMIFSLNFFSLTSISLDTSPLFLYNGRWSSPNQKYLSSVNNTLSQDVFPVKCFMQKSILDFFCSSVKKNVRGGRYIYPSCFLILLTVVGDTFGKLSSPLIIFDNILFDILLFLRVISSIYTIRSIVCLQGAPILAYRINVFS